MALSRKKWNNIIIIITILMISILTLLDRKTANIPDDATPLFDEKSPLTQLQIDKLWLNKGASSWQCHPNVLNCQSWAEAWSHIHLSALDQQFEAVDNEAAKKIVIQIADKSQPQLWRFFAKSGLLESPAKNWYQIPPSQREALTPIIKAEAFIEP
ncbi:hypothetical protein FM038_000645 [Shewanella eurypsychrophilus]|uniref:Uncharacterized protein n=1 Tax=Shewanella eurypsychrophilus TaxID=2593656 RepID=A0ABX6V0F2_9GAMM|nr:MULTISPECIES: hypothetical protein [Shewanella]QFU20526.1 hypothetical protein FS418_00635 [Shewanella sp. YLB-09]QFU20807.1 hypothetical protein FS418_02245 [Shewanella sp. YLB-09]QPG56100.1 hypothetical protein FM038_000645 [Shewanella eurypsychrophilus]